MINYKNKSSSGLLGFLQKLFFYQRTKDWIAFAVIFFAALMLGYLMAEKTVFGLGITALIFSLFIAFVCIINSEAGLYINIFYSFFISHFNRLLFNDSLPEGIFSDILIAITFLGLFVRKVSLRQSINEFTKTPVMITFLFLYGYMALELFNPYASSFAGWFPAFRKILGTLLLLFTCYNTFNNLESIKRFVKVLFVLSIIVAIYGCIQQWHGFFDFEMNWLRAEPKRFRMTFVNGGARKMSTFPDAPSFAILMAVCTVFFTAICLGVKKTYQKIISFIGIIFTLLGMTYSITRTANAMLVGGIGLFILLTLDKLSSRILAVASVFLFVLLMYGPFENQQIDQFRTTFEGSKNSSFNVREENRKSVQPYIYAHPIGGGLNTTGGEGLMYNPGHDLAGFPPDSGSLKKALEMGWIGFALICLLYFLVLRTCIHGYFSCKTQEIKLIYAACTGAFFAFYVGDFSQVAIGQITDVVVYYPLIAVILKLKQFDSA